MKGHNYFLRFVASKILCLLYLATAYFLSRLPHDMSPELFALTPYILLPLSQATS